MVTWWSQAILASYLATGQALVDGGDVDDDCAVFDHASKKHRQNCKSRSRLFESCATGSAEGQDLQGTQESRVSESVECACCQAQPVRAMR